MLREPPETLARAVAGMIADSAGEFVLFHTDITRLPASPGARSKIEALHLFADALEAAVADRTAVFPAFNYDYCRTGRYDTAEDPCQVGTLNEFYRRHRAALRTLTPVFNFTASDTRLPPDLSANPFDEDSTFARLRHSNAAVVFLGAPFATNTFLHHVEERAEIGYRYLKPFPGVVQDAGRAIPVRLQYRVRPLQDGVVAYDWNRLALELGRAGVLKVSSFHGVPLLSYEAGRLAEFWGERLARDEFCLLTADSVEAVRRLAGDVGYPFRYERLEGSG